jgi:hypothetical protein
MTAITCERCGRTTTDPDRWDPEADTGRVFCDACWPHRHEPILRVGLAVVADGKPGSITKLREGGASGTLYVRVLHDDGHDEWYVASDLTEAEGEDR